MMSAYDRWATQGPPEAEDEPELTGLALEAQNLVDALYELANDACADWVADGGLPPAMMTYVQRVNRIAARADKRVQRRIDLNIAAAWHGHYAMCDADELAYLEHEAREQGEADVMQGGFRAALMELIDMGEWTWSEADDASLYTIHLRESHYQELIELIARGTGKDLRGCDECHTEHDIQKCPAIRKELFR